MRKCVLQIHVPSLKYRSAVWLHGHFASSLFFKPRFVKYFVMFFGYITWVYVLPVSKLMTNLFSRDFAQYLSLLAMIYR